MKRRSEKGFVARLRGLGRKLLLINDSPERIARGFAIGVFWGIMPTFGFAWIFSLPIAFLLRANKVSAVLGTFVSNPFTVVFFYTLGYKFGTQIFQPTRVDFSWNVFDRHFFFGVWKSIGEGFSKLLGGDLSVLWTFLMEIKSWLVGSGLFAAGIAILSYLLLLMILLVIVPLIRRLRSSWVPDAGRTKSSSSSRQHRGVR